MNDVQHMGVASQELQRAVASALFGEDHAGLDVVVGRYAIIGRIGSGAMGAVYRAYDPDLKREVALKVVEIDRGNAATHNDLRERTLREAQMLAQLAHPNVVAVHDVGQAPRGLYLAMELVGGSDLEQWLKGHPPDGARRNALALTMVLQAAQGLAAAHAAGVVHRDIKPANILIGDDGRIRVADFGLARQHSDALDSLAGSSATDYDTTESLTQTGAVIGTPAYMAPEQLRGEPADERSDVFSLCVTAFELLVGVRPFQGTTIVAQLSSIEHGAIEMPTGTKVSRGLQRALRRGLAADPNDRYASMNELVAALEHVRGRVQRRRTWVVLATGATGLMALVASLTGGESDYERCASTASRLGALVADHSERVRTQFSDTVAVGKQVYARTREGLDHHAAAWGDALETACEATWKHAKRSQAGFDATFRCLDRQYDTTERLLQTLAGATRETVVAAPRVVWSLPSPQRCADVEGVDTPTDPDARRQWEAHLTNIGHAHTLAELGQMDAAEQLADTTLAAVKQAGFTRLVARVQLTRSDLEDQRRSPDEAVRLADEALWTALSVGDSETVATATLRMSYLVGVEQGKFKDGLRWSDRAEAAIGALRDPRQLDSDRRFFRAAIHGAAGNPDQALKLLKVIVDAGPTQDVPLRYASALRSYGSRLIELARHDEAAEALEQALVIQLRYAGPWTEAASAILVQQGQNQMKLGNYDEARDFFERALEIRQVVVGPDTISTSEVFQVLSIVSHLSRRDEDAARFGARAYTIAVGMLGAEHPRSVAYGLNVVNARLGQQRFAEALQALRPLVRDAQAAWGPDSLRYATVLTIRAQIYHGLARYDDAATDFHRVLTLRKAALGPTHPRVGQDETGLARVEFARGNFALALELGEHARTLLIEAYSKNHEAVASVDKLIAELHAATARAPSTPELDGGR